MNEIVAACPWRDRILIFTRKGEVYSLQVQEDYGSRLDFRITFEYRLEFPQ